MKHLLLSLLLTLSLSAARIDQPMSYTRVKIIHSYTVEQLQKDIDKFLAETHGRVMTISYKKEGQWHTCLISYTV